MHLKQDTLYIFTDGSCYPNPGPGGWGAVLVWNGSVKFLYGGSANETNNSMELAAILGGLKARTDKNVPTILYTDSQYCVKIMTQWWRGWKAKGWVTGSGSPVKNKEYIQEILPYTHNVQFKWIKGHDGHALNEAADVLSRKGRANYGGDNTTDPDPDLKETKNYTYPYVSKWSNCTDVDPRTTPFEDGQEVEIVDISQPTGASYGGGSLRDTLAAHEFMRRTRGALTGVADDVLDKVMASAYEAVDIFMVVAKRNGKL